MLLVFLLLTLTGCWDNQELNDQALLLSIGLDKVDDKYVLSNQFARNPKESQGEKSPQTGFYTEIAEGKNLMESSNIMQSKVTRLINRGQRRSMVIGENLARQGFRESLDFVIRNPESPLRLNLFIVKNGMASDMLKSSTPFGAQSMREYFKLLQTNFGAVDVGFMFLVRTMNEGMDFGDFVPVLEKVKSINDQDQDFYRFNGAAVLNNQTKLVGYLDLNETDDASWIVNWPHHHLNTIPSPNDKGTITMDFQRMKRKWSFHFGQELGVKLNLQADAILVENTSNMDLLNESTIAVFKHEMEKKLEQQILSLIRKFQKEFKTDAIGVGESIYRNHPNQWKLLKKEWDRTFSEVDMDVKVSLKFIRFGLTGASGSLNKEEIERGQR
nr:Ger(x)C family spore germination protein [Paenibacillus taichungensis]